MNRHKMILAELLKIWEKHPLPDFYLAIAEMIDRDATFAKGDIAKKLRETSQGIRDTVAYLMRDQ